jgi:hypothetical protein
MQVPAGSTLETMFRHAVGAALLIFAACAPAISQTLPAPARTVTLSGPRVGVTSLSQGVVDRLKEHNLDIRPVITQFGWQFEKQFYGRDSGLSAVNEWVVLLGGLEQGHALPSVSWLVGLRTREGTEFGIGPNVTPLGVALTVAAGVTFRAGILNVPVNVAVVPSGSGVRLSVLTGFNLRRSNRNADRLPASMSPNPGGILLERLNVHHPPEDLRIEPSTGLVARGLRGDRSPEAEARPVDPSGVPRRQADVDVRVPPGDGQRHTRVELVGGRAPGRRIHRAAEDVLSILPLVEERRRLLGVERERAEESVPPVREVILLQRQPGEEGSIPVTLRARRIAIGLEHAPKRLQERLGPLVVRRGGWACRAHLHVRIGAAVMLVSHRFERAGFLV